MPRPRDSQKTKFYTWKSSSTLGALRPPAGIIPLIDWANMESTIISYVSSYGYRAPSFKWKKFNYTIGFEWGTILLDARQVQFRPEIVAQAVAYYVCWMKHTSGDINEAWHGPTFCRVFAEVYASQTGLQVQDIIKSMRAAKLKVAGSGAPAGPRVTKRYEKACTEVENLERSIKNARKEFEEFLKPVLAKLDVAKKQKSELESKIRG